MPEPSPRRLTMAGLMILIGGSAAGIAWSWAYFRRNADSFADASWAYRLHNLLLFANP